MQRLLKNLPFQLQINKREKIAIWIGVGVVGLFLVLQLIVNPFIDSRRRLFRRIEVQTQTLQEMQELRMEYASIQGSADEVRASVAARRTGFTLFSFLDSLAGQAGLKDRIAYMKPSTSTQPDAAYRTTTVETKLQAITLKQLLNYIYRIETSRNMVRLTRLSVTKTGKQEGTVDAVLLVETF
jgi:general secretion pathway protein M